MVVVLVVVWQAAQILVCKTCINTITVEQNWDELVLQCIWQLSS